jgi:hypothetical protein
MEESEEYKRKTQMTVRFCSHRDGNRGVKQASIGLPEEGLLEETLGRPLPSPGNPNPAAANQVRQKMGFLRVGGGEIPTDQRETPKENQELRGASLSELRRAHLGENPGLGVQILGGGGIHGRRNGRRAELF